MSIQISFSEIAKQDLRDIWRGLAEYIADIDRCYQLFWVSGKCDV
jgi:hypothetical protein